MIFSLRSMRPFGPTPYLHETNKIGCAPGRRGVFRSYQDESEWIVHTSTSPFSLQLAWVEIRGANIAPTELNKVPHTQFLSTALLEDGNDVRPGAPPVELPAELQPLHQLPKLCGPVKAAVAADEALPQGSEVWLS